jgi:hypothetical protein
MFKQIGAKIVPITRRYAEQFSSLPTSRGDRNLDTPKGRKHVAWLNTLIHEGKFHSPKWAVAILDGVTYRVNGGHSSMMLAELNGEFPVGLTATVDTFTCDTLRDLAELFSQFDSRQSIRTVTDKARAHAAISDRLSAIAPTYISRAVYGIAWSLTGYADSRHVFSEDERISLMHDYEDFIVWVRQFIGFARMGGVSKIGAMFETHQSYPYAADVFWRQITTECHPDNNHPTRRIASYYKEILMISNRSKSSLRTTYSKTVHAWNAAVEGRTTNLAHYKNAPVPLIRCPAVSEYLRS